MCSCLRKRAMAAAARKDRNTTIPSTYVGSIRCVYYGHGVLAFATGCRSCLPVSREDAGPNLDLTSSST